MTTPRKYCNVTGKQMFRSRKHAAVVRSSVKKDLRIYKCEHCHHLHFTSERMY